MKIYIITDERGEIRTATLSGRIEAWERAWYKCTSAPENEPYWPAAKKRAGWRCHVLTRLPINNPKNTKRKS